MHLWNDYEGKTIAGQYMLGALLRTEGRSASFATRGIAGRAAVIRLTETLNDEQEMRARYRAIQAAAHPNLVVIEDFGEAEFEGTPLLYVVTEPTEESLTEILELRRLSVEETGEVALSALGGLEALHAHGLVHGLVEPASVLAVGEVIKLRTDCVRPAPEGGDGARARYEDVFGLADVLNRSLTQQHLQDASDALALPEPYASVVRNVVRGTWGLEQVAGELRRYVRSSMAHAAATPVAAAAGGSAARPRPVAPVAPVAAAHAETGRGKVASAAETPTFAEALAAANRVVDLAAAASRDEAGAEPGSVESAPRGRTTRRVAGVAADPQLPLVYTEGAADATLDLEGVGGDAQAERKRRTMWIAGCSAVLLVLLLLLWFGSSGRNRTAGTAGAPIAGSQAAPASRSSAAQPSAAQPPVTPTSPPMVAATEGPRTSGRSAAAPATPEPAGAAETLPQPSPGGRIWRVVAYTYNRQDQAEAKARTIAALHRDLRPQVFSRTGHAPYLVTLGGPLSQQAAGAMRHRARAEGLARDVYMQNYSH